MLLSLLLLVGLTDVSRASPAVFSTNVNTNTNYNVNFNYNAILNQLTTFVQELIKNDEPHEQAALINKMLDQLALLEDEGVQSEEDITVEPDDPAPRRSSLREKNKFNDIDWQCLIN